MFCQSCGAQMTGGFCASCGARAPQASGASAPPPPPPTQTPYAAPPAPPQYAQPSYAAAPLAPPAKTGAGMKILLVVLGIIGLMGVLFIGGVWYVAHKVKEKAAENGINLSDLADTRTGPARRLDACDLLSKAELSEIVKIPIERTESTGASANSSCRYYSAEASQKAADEAGDTIKRLQENKQGTPAPTPDEAMKQLNTLIRGATTSQANGLILSVGIETQNAKGTMAAFKIANGLVTKAMGVKENSGLGGKIDGVGDEAYMGPLASLMGFRKGDVTVQLDGRTLPGGKDAQIAIARKIASKL